MINSILNKYKLIFNDPSEIMNLVQNYDPNKFTRIYNKILKDQNFKNIFCEQVNVEKIWLNFFEKKL